MQYIHADRCHASLHIRHNDKQNAHTWHKHVLESYFEAYLLTHIPSTNHFYNISRYRNISLFSQGTRASNHIYNRRVPWMASAVWPRERRWRKKNNNISIYEYNVSSVHGSHLCNNCFLIFPSHFFLSFISFHFTFDIIGNTGRYVSEWYEVSRCVELGIFIRSEYISLRASHANPICTQRMYTHNLFKHRAVGSVFSIYFTWNAIILIS